MIDILGHLIGCGCLIGRGHLIEGGRLIRVGLCISIHSIVIYFQEFPHENDTCYLAHCYPYSYTDLELYLRSIVDNPKISQHVQKEVIAPWYQKNCPTIGDTTGHHSNSMSG